MRFLVVTPSSRLGAKDFSGARTFFALATSLGISAADMRLLAWDDPAFDYELEHLSASVAICLGDKAFERLTGIGKSFLDMRGYLFTPSDCLPVKTTAIEQIGLYKTAKKGHHAKGDPRFGKVHRFKKQTLPQHLRWIIGTYDPFVMIAERKEPLPVVKADLQRALRALDPLFTRLEAPIVSTPPSEAGFLTLDIETFGFTGGVERIGLATRSTTWSSIWTNSARHATQEAIDRANSIQGHNLAFDIPRLKAEGIEFRQDLSFFDTMIASTLLHPCIPKALEKVASIYLDIAPWKHMSVQDPAYYNACDAFYTHQLAISQRRELEEIGMLSLFTNTIMPATSVLMEMTKHGLKIDSVRLAEWQKLLSTELEVATNQWFSFVSDVNPNSPSQLIYHFYNDLGLKKQFTKRKKDGQSILTLSTDEDALNALMRLYPEHVPMLESLLKIKKISKNLSTYASHALDHNNCIHPSYLPSSKYAENGSAKTGRLASTGPNVQNQTHDSKLMFIPHFENWALVEFDFSQIELRIAAALSADRTLQQALEGDVHARTMDLLGCDRVRAKNVLYGSLYGGGARKLARLLTTKGYPTTEGEAGALQDALAHAYPRLWAWRSAVASQGLANGHLTNPFGRRRFFYAASDSIPEMYDYLPQSTAADILWALLVPLNDFAHASGGHFLTTTHDSGLFEFPIESIGPALHQNLRDVCEREWPQIAPGFKVPIVIKTGPNWATLSPI